MVQSFEVGHPLDSWQMLLRFSHQWNRGNLWWFGLIWFCLSTCLSGVFSHRTSCSRARSSRPSATRAVTPAATSSRNHYIKAQLWLVNSHDLSWFIVIYHDLSKIGWCNWLVIYPKSSEFIPNYDGYWLAFFHRTFTKKTLVFDGNKSYPFVGWFPHPSSTRFASDTQIRWLQ